MSGGLSLGKLFVQFGADTSELDRGEVHAKQKLGSIAKSSADASDKMVEHAKRAGAAFTVAMTGVAYAVKTAIDEVVKLANTAETLGVPIAKLSALEFAAKRVGVEAGVLTAALTVLTKRISDRDSLSEGVRLFEALGMSIRNADGSTKSANQVFDVLVGKLQMMQSGVAKTTLVTQLFGESGAKLMPLFSQGSEGIKKLTSEAEKLGLVINDDTAASFQKMHEAVSQAKSVFDAIIAQIASKLQPVFAAASEAFKQFTSNSNAMDAVVDVLATSLKVLVTVGVAIGNAFTVTAQTISTVASAVYQMATGQFAKAWETLKSGAKATVESLTTAGEFYSKTWVETTDTMVKAATTVENKVKPPVVRTAEEITKALEGMRKMAQWAFDDLMNSPTASIEEKLQGIVTMAQKGQISFRDFDLATQRLREDGFKQLRTEAQYLMEDLDNLPIMSAAEKMDILTEKVKNGAISWREFNATTRNVTNQNKQAMNDLLSTTSQVLSALFAKNKSAAIGAALINTYQGITKALAEYPPPISYAMAGLQAALGFAQVRSITSTNEGSSAGAAGASAVPAAAPAAQASAPSNTLFVQGFSADGFFSGDAVRGLAERLLDYQRDGGKVVLAGQ